MAATTVPAWSPPLSTHFLLCLLSLQSRYLLTAVWIHMDLRTSLTRALCYCVHCAALTCVPHFLLPESKVPAPEMVDAQKHALMNASGVSPHV